MEPWQILEDPYIGSLGLGNPLGGNLQELSNGDLHVTHYWEDGIRLSYNIGQDGSRYDSHGWCGNHPFDVGE